MIVHVVMFRPRPGLLDTEKRGLFEALIAAVQDIPSIRSARVGTRLTHGRAYEQLMHADYPYAAILEFDDVAGLKAYLEHPSHQTLARRFFETFEDALMYDFEVRDARDAAVTLLR